MQSKARRKDWALKKKIQLLSAVKKEFFTYMTYVNMVFLVSSSNEFVFYRP